MPETKINLATIQWRPARGWEPPLSIRGGKGKRFKKTNTGIGPQATAATSLKHGTAVRITTKGKIKPGTIAP